MPKTQFSRNQFTFYRAYFDSVEHLPKARRYEALRALILYALEGVSPEALSPAAAGVFEAIRPNLDSGRTKAAARLKELSADPFLSVPDLPAGNNKKENKNKKEKENKNEEENKEEREDEYKEAGRRAPARMAEEADDLSRLAQADPKVERALEQFLRHWEKLSDPLTAEERRLLSWSLAVHTPEEQTKALCDALFQNARQVSFSARSPS